MKIEFQIEHLDPLAQGVCKKENEIFFISKTLPNETGTATVYRQRQGVSFAYLNQLQQKAENRILPTCPHYQECHGCHYLHTDYTSEITFKKNALMRMLRKIPNCPDVLAHAAPTRNLYRNRMQFHYDQKNFGLISPINQQIIPVPNCQLPIASIQERIKKLYQEENWKALSKAAPSSGHFELYQKEEELCLTFNQPYADGGFSQINPMMNQFLQQRISQIIKELPTSANSVVFDLFGGNGNLSRQALGKSYVIDQIPPPNHCLAPHQEFIRLNLYAKNAITQLTTKVGEQNIGLLIIDPPRTGMKNLQQFVEKYSPEFICYLSCNAMTAIRDLLPLFSHFHLTQVELFDFFPSTKHFETLLCLRRNNSFCF